MISGLRPVRQIDPEGVADCSHGWSEAEPVEQVKKIRLRPGRGGGKLLRGCEVPSPLRGEHTEYHRFHGFRFAPPVATIPRPVGADNDDSGKFGTAIRFTRVAFQGSTCGSISPSVKPSHSIMYWS